MIQKEDILLTVSLADYIAATGISLADYNLIGVSHTERNRVWGGGKLPPIDETEEDAKKVFLKKIPADVLVVVDLKIILQETPSGFFSDGLQFVSFHGTAIVPKLKKT